MSDPTDPPTTGQRSTAKLIVSYTIVGVPLLYGLIATAIKASQLFA